MKTFGELMHLFAGAIIAGIFQCELGIRAAPLGSFHRESVVEAMFLFLCIYVCSCLWLLSIP
jgi:hypothetical protein